jgi:peptidoglycan/xylan/chitin deacetylase (PgdA/CDA1 family)
VFNLTLHGVGEPTRPFESGEEAVWLSVAALENVLDESSMRRDVNITFDDGNRSDAEIALRELATRSLTATFFVVAGRIDREGFLGRDDLEELVEAGHALGSHGMEHRPWRGLGRLELERELKTSKETLEAIAGRPVIQLSCPFGSYDRRVLRGAFATGYELVFTSDGGAADSRARLQPRTTIASNGKPTVAQIVHASRGDAIARRAKRTVKRWR